MLVPLVINSQAGIKRDGTQFEGNFYIDGQWVRFQRNLPRKMNGYVSINKYVLDISRGMKTYTQTNNTYVHTGSASRLQRFVLNEQGNSSIVVTRSLVNSTTGANALQVNNANQWQFDVLYDSISLTGQGNKLIAQVAPNGSCICNNLGGQLFVGDLTATTPLVEVPIPLGGSASGGVTVLHPYAVFFGNDGFLSWSAPGQPTVFYQFEYNALALQLSYASYAGQSRIVLNGDQTTLVKADDVLTFASPVNYPVTVLSSTHGNNNYSVLTMTSSAITDYPGGSVIYTGATTGLITVGSTLSGSTSFVVAGDQRTVFTTGTLFTFDSLSNAVYKVTSSSFTTPNTTVNFSPPLLTTYPSATNLYKFSASAFSTTDVIVTGQSQFFVASGNVTITAGTYIYFNNSSLLNNYKTYLLSAVQTVSSTVVTLTAPLTQSFNAGAVIYKQDATSPTGAGNARIAGQKLVRGLPLRGGPGNAPSGLFWSADALVRMSFVGGDQIFQFDTISSQISVLSSASIIEYDGVYYWLGTDRFLMFNGVVRDLPNVMNINWFFDNLNRSQASKCFAFKVPRYGEIWWCAPLFDATECNYAIIYNTRENSWYDTKLPNSGRSAGEFSPVFGYPILAGVNFTQGLSSESGYKFWRHEVGYDEIDGANLTPIDSWFETADFSFVAQSNNAKNKAVRVAMLEPDFVQTGDMTVELTGRANARSAQLYGEIKTIYDIPKTPEEQIVFFKEQYRELRFRFRSNTVGGSYQMGQCIAYIEEGDGTILGTVAKNPGEYSR